MGINAGRVAKVIDHAIEKFVELIVEKYMTSNNHVILYNPSGDDSVPVKKDRAFIIRTDGTGKLIAVGILNESQGAKPGEKYLYARTQKGKKTNEIQMLNDGTININTNQDDSETGDYNKEIKGNETHDVMGDRDIVVAGNEDKNVDGDAQWVIGGNLKILVGGSTQIISSGSTTVNGSVDKFN